MTRSEIFWRSACWFGAIWTAWLVLCLGLIIFTSVLKCFVKPGENCIVPPVEQFKEEENP